MIYTVSLNPAIDRTVRVDTLRLHEINTAELQGHVPAGKGINVCRTLSCLGVQSTVIGLIGINEEKWFSEYLSRQEIISSFVPVNGLTRISLTVMDGSGENETHIKETGFRVSGDEIDRLCSLLSETISDKDTVCLTGSAPPGVSGDHLRSIAEILNSRGGYSVCDLNGNLLSEVNSCTPSLIKPNEDELSGLTGRTEPDEMLKAALDMGFEHILFTRGADGAEYYSADTHFFCKAPEIKLASTVGAGDASLAGFLGARASGCSEEKCLKWAVAAGSANAEEPFAGNIDRTRFDELLTQLEVISHQ